MKKMFFISLSLTILLTITACAKEGNSVEQRINKLEEEVQSLRQDVGNIKTDLAEANNEEGVMLYFLKTTQNEFYLSPENRNLPENQQNPTRALEELLLGPSPGSSLKPVMPEGTKLLNFKLEDGIATVNFNSEFMRNMNAGARMEDLILSAVVNTLTEFPQIEAVQFLIEGQKVETIGGHIETSGPLTRNENVIR